MDDYRPLIGKTLSNDWKVTDEIENNGTGGFFSVGFLVEKESGEKGFMKVVNYLQAFDAPDPSFAMENLIKAFRFEKNLCMICKDKGLKRVVHAIDEGIYRDKGLPQGLAEYLIFEMAQGDIRSHLSAQETFDTAWNLRTMHNATTGLMELHAAGIAHQDVKPSNVLVFTKQVSKVADLGSASQEKGDSPRDQLSVAGDRTYAPPELLLNFPMQDWEQRKACDLYLLGNLFSFLFANANMTSQIISHLGDFSEWYNQDITFEEAIPYLVNAHDSAIEEIAQSFPEEIDEDMKDILRQLTNPDPRKRGHPKEIKGKRNTYGLQRYVSQFNLMASRAELNLKRSS